MSGEANKRASSGEFVASKLPLGGADGLPISWQLCVIMAHVFVLFNQGLFVLMAFLKRVQEDVPLSNTFALLSLIAGALLVAFALFVFVAIPVKKALDYGIVLLALTLLASVFLQKIDLFSTDGLLRFFCSNLLISIWFGRGLLRLWLAKKA